MEKKMNLGNICKSMDVATIDISWSLQAAAALMMRHRIAALIVTDRGKPVGLISERDLVSALADTGSRVARIPIREVVTGPIPAVSAGETIMHAIALMTEKHLRFLPVFDNSELIGMVTLRDLIKYRLQEIELEAMSPATWQPRGDSSDGSLGSYERSPLPHNDNVPEVPGTLLRLE
jgi:signal-transduction protein with cAMP-binding, CBS, and nucleotidyltransferase domain